MNMDKATVEKLVDFCLRPDNIQDLAYGTSAIKNEDGTAFICPQWIRKNYRAKMIRAFKQEFSNQTEKMPSRTWMYKMIGWVAKKDMLSLVGLDNTDVAGKKAMTETEQKVGDMGQDMELCKSVLRQDLEDSMHTNSHVYLQPRAHGM